MRAVIIEPDHLFAAKPRRHLQNTYLVDRACDRPLITQDEGTMSNTQSTQQTVTKAQIVDDVYRELNKDKEQTLVTRKASAKLVDQVFELIKDEIHHLKDELDSDPAGAEERPERRLKISGFGNFIIRYKRSRPGRNPQNGEKIDISSRYVLTFKPSQVLKKAINHPDGPEASKVSESLS